MPDPSLSIAISSDQRQNIQACRKSIQEQNYSGKLDLQVYNWSRFPDRLQAVKKAQYDQVLLLDGDCVLPHRNFLKGIAKVRKRHPRAAVLGGGYQDAPENTYWDRAYNQMCNNWVQHGLQANGQPQNLLGGCLLFLRENLPAKLRLPKIDFWGGEDTFLIRKLLPHVQVAHCKELDVLHRPGNDFYKTVRRGFQHGKNRNRLNLATRAGQRVPLPPIQHWPWWALHFSALEAGAVWQQVRGSKSPANNPKA